MIYLCYLRENSANIHKSKQKLLIQLHREDVRLGDSRRVSICAEEPMRAGMCTWSKRAGAQGYNKNQYCMITLNFIVLFLILLALESQQFDHTTLKPNSQQTVGKSFENRSV